MWYSQFSFLRADFSGLRRIRCSGKMIVVFCCAFIACLLAACGGSPVTSASSPTASPHVTATQKVVPTPISPTSTPVPTATPVPQSNNAPQAAQPGQAAAPGQAAQPGPILDVAPISMGLSGHVNCRKGPAAFFCRAAVISRPRNQVALQWKAFANIAGVSFNPSQGSVAPGTRVVLIIRIPAQECSGTFFFQGPVNTHTISWTC